MLFSLLFFEFGMFNLSKFWVLSVLSPWILGFGSLVFGLFGFGFLKSLFFQLIMNLGFIYQNLVHSVSILFLKTLVPLWGAFVISILNFGFGLFKFNIGFGFWFLKGEYTWAEREREHVRASIYLKINICKMIVSILFINNVMFMNF